VSAAAVTQPETAEAAVERPETAAAVERPETGVPPPAEGMGTGRSKVSLR
jgi:hypothetical protein